jgi:membrane protease YdiL (CAAX protease family)
VWRRIPAVVRAVLTGLAVMVAGQFPWSILIVVNLRQPHSPPWAVPIMALYLTLYWRYLNGWGWPTRSAQMRRDSFRARGLPGNVWLRAMASGMLAVAAAVMLQNAYGRLVPIPAAIAPDFSPYPWYTVLLPLLMGGTVSGVAEEAGFRGYMQSAIEREHGPVVAIAVVSLAFAAIHFTHGVSSTLPRLPYYLAISVIYGMLTYRTGSILPALAIHAGGNALEYLIVWRWGIRHSAPLIWQSGPDVAFWHDLGLGLVLGMAAVWAYKSLRQVRSSIPAQPPEGSFGTLRPTSLPPPLETQPGQDAIFFPAATIALEGALRKRAALEAWPGGPAQCDPARTIT